jgi:replicative DNA helicase
LSEEYSKDLQKLFLEFMISNHDLYVRTSAITQSSYYDRDLRSAVKMIQEHVDKYGEMPTISQLKAKTGVVLSDVSNDVEGHQNWFLDEYEKFCRHKAIEAAILASTDKLERKEYGAVEKLIKDAVSIGLAKELGTNYWEDPVARINSVKEDRGGMSTGWKSVDDILYGGFNRGELNIFAAPSGHGKSLVLQNLGLNWAFQNYNVVYVTLELSEKLCSMRLDSMVTGYSTKELFKNVEDAGLKISMRGKNAGSLQIVQLPNGITSHDLRAFVKEYQIQTGLKVDAVLLDYLDLMSPSQKKVSMDNTFLKDKMVSEELRNFAVEGNYLFATASQINRTGVDAPEFDHSHIAGGISKINTGDNVIGIMATNAMKERGIMQFQFMKTRSSAGVGRKVDLEYAVESMRISDLPEDQQGKVTETVNMIDKLKLNNQSNDDVDNSKPSAPRTPTKIDTDRLRSILKRKE